MDQAGSAAHEKYDISFETNPDVSKDTLSKGMSLLSTSFKLFDNVRVMGKASSAMGTDVSIIQAVTKGNLGELICSRSQSEEV